LSRISGKNGRVYINILSGGTSEPIAFLNQWDMTFTTEKQDVTAFGDANKTYVSGLPDAQFTYAGFYDNATAQTYTAATDGVARKFYFYPDNTATTQYWWGTAILDFSIKTAQNGGVSISGSAAAATAIVKVG
jgi:hypothetical protein